MLVLLLLVSCATPSFYLSVVTDALPPDMLESVGLENLVSEGQRYVVFAVRDEVNGMAILAGVEVGYEDISILDGDFRA